MATRQASDLDFTNTSLIVNLDPTETRQGVIEIATQVEVDAGLDDTRAVTPLKLANFAFPGTVKGFAATFGDGVSLTYTIPHNLGTLDVQVEVYAIAAPSDTVDVQRGRPDANNVELTFAAGNAPALNSLRVVVTGVL